MTWSWNDLKKVKQLEKQASDPAMQNFKNNFNKNHPAMNW